MSETKNPPEWNHIDDKPNSGPGFYAVCYCWDASEGFFADGTEWTGEKWAGNFPFIVAFAGPFPSLEEAEAWAEDNEPGSGK